MENKANQERILAFNLATEITAEDIEQVSGGVAKGSSTRRATSDTTWGGQDHTYDSDSD